MKHQNPETDQVPGDDQVEEVVTATFDALQLVLGVAAGALIGLALALAVVAISKLVSNRSPYYAPVHRRVTRPATVLLSVIGGGFGYRYAKAKVDPEVAPAWLNAVEHMFLIAIIIIGGWLVASIFNGVVTAIYDTVGKSSQERAARVETQVQIIHRVVSVLIWVVVLAAVLLTFPGARAAGASLLASAGLISVVAGLAAQSVLGNVFAGLQLAFSDSMRVGDIVFYQQTMATVEEITLTYVVLSVWDGRRIIVPSSNMTSESFENWTRRQPDMMGSVEWQVDWTVPVRQARKHLEHLLRNTDLWDGETGVLQVSDALGGTVTIKAIVSAKDSPTLSDLKNYIREAMVQWIQDVAPHAMPHQRRIIDDAPNFREVTDRTAQAVREELADEPPSFTPDSDAPSGGVITAPTTVISANDGEVFSRTPIAKRDTDMTIVMEPISEVYPVEEEEEKPAGYESAIFRGSEQADKRAEQYAGPGEEAYEERAKKIETGKHPVVTDSADADVDSDVADDDADDAVATNSPDAEREKRGLGRDEHPSDDTMDRNE